MFHVKHSAPDWQGDTIAAIASPPGEGGVGVIRISGAEALPILRRLFYPVGKGKISTHKLVHGWIKNELKQYTDKAIPVVYGGSANEKNVVSLLAQEMIDGVLPGNASTKFETFISLIKEAEKVS